MTDDIEFPLTGEQHEAPIVVIVPVAIPQEDDD